MASTNTPFPLGVYPGGPNGSDPVANAIVINQLQSYASLLGADPQFVDGYIDQAQSIDQWDSNASWEAWSFAQTPIASQATPVIGLPMATNADAGNPDGVFQAFASGQYDDVLDGLVSAWKDEGFTTQYWRPGYEMNVPQMPWYVGTDKQTQSDYISAFQHISSVLHSAGQADGVNVQVVWSPNAQNGSDVDTASLYPGNQAVDVIGPDLYDNIYPRDLYDWDKNDGTVDSNFQQWSSDPVNLEHYFTYPDGSQYHPTGDGQDNSISLLDYIAMAKADGKPIALSETGAGGGGSSDISDDPAFVKALATMLQNAGVPVAFVNMWDSEANGNWDFSSSSANKPLESAAWAQYFGAGAGPVSSTPATDTPATVGNGPDSIVVNMSEDAWQGDAQVTLSVDGQQIGGTQTITASHGAGQTQGITLQGDFDAGPHTLAVDFLNDAYGGASDADRNVYVDNISDNGVTSPVNAALMSGGAQDFGIASVADASSGEQMAFITSSTQVAPSGDATLTASASSQTFDFTAGDFGHDAISGFDPSSDVLALNTQQAPSFTTLQDDVSANGGSTLLTLDSNHSILLQGVAPSSLGGSNFAIG